jgi:hypothetical protein
MHPDGKSRRMAFDRAAMIGSMSNVRKATNVAPDMAASSFEKTIARLVGMYNIRIDLKRRPEH